MPANGRDRAGRRLGQVSAALLAASVLAAPLLAGGVHRPTATAVLMGVGLALLCGAAGESLRGRWLAGARFSHFFLLMLAIPALQLVPLPAAVRSLLDPAGSALLANAPQGTPAAWPLSLDPPATRRELGTAGATLAVFLLAFAQATGRQRHRLLAKAVAVAGVLAVASGIAHRLFGISGLYGVLGDTGGVLPGPMVNPNHSAELYEIAAFSALALALGAAAEARIAWAAAAVVSAAGALATLSRGSLLALMAGAVAFALLRGRAQGDPTGVPSPSRVWRGLAAALLAVGAVAALALALGAAPILDEIAHTEVRGKADKPAIWKDSLPLVANHPAGVGRHGYDRVYPAYKTLPQNMRFNFVENAPLQLLIDTGVAGFAILAAGLGLWIFQMRRRRRGDDVEAALIAALIAVLVHNLVDFGLEVPGIRIPFAALAGAVMGRTYARETRPEGSRRGTALGAAAAAGLAVGLWALWQPGPEEIEARWRTTSQPHERRDLAVSGGRLVPTDYFFPLLQSFDEPFEPAAGRGPSPRLAALNRALRLCPACPEAHREVARAMTRLGRRSQALASWRDTVRLDSSALSGALVELSRLGYRPAELATLAVGSGEDILAIAYHLTPMKAQAEVTALVAAARDKGVPEADLALLQADLAIALGDRAAARRILDAAQSASPRDGRPRSRLATLEASDGRLAAALAHARVAASLAPESVEFSRQRLRIVLDARAWTDLDQALDGLAIALRQGGLNVAEVNRAAGQAHESRGDLGRALTEYRLAAALEPEGAGNWVAVARVSEAVGDLVGARDAHQKVVSLHPGDRGARESVERASKMIDEARLRKLIR